MASRAIVFHPNLPGFGIVARYYSTVRSEPTKAGRIGVDGSYPFAPNFLALVEAIVGSRRTNVIVATHGSPERGMALPLAPESDLWCAAALDHLKDLVDEVAKTKGKSIDA